MILNFGSDVSNLRSSVGSLGAADLALNKLALGVFNMLVLGLISMLFLGLFNLLLLAVFSLLDLMIDFLDDFIRF